jgi:hypothetical protein
MNIEFGNDYADIVITSIMTRIRIWKLFRFFIIYSNMFVISVKILFIKVKISIKNKVFSILLEIG